jgi:hypothetical protein
MEKDQQRRQKEDSTGARQPDPETLGTTDPQEHMKGPVSSSVQKVKEEVEEEAGKRPKEKKD